MLDTIEKRRSDKTVSIENNFFLLPEMKHVSAIIYSPINIVNSYDRFGIDIRVIHNPLAANKIPLGTFRFGREVWVDANGILKTKDHSKANLKWRWHQFRMWIAGKWFVIRNHREIQKIKADVKRRRVEAELPKTPTC